MRSLIEFSAAFFKPFELEHRVVALGIMKRRFEDKRVHREMIHSASALCGVLAFTIGKALAVYQLEIVLHLSFNKIPQGLERSLHKSHFVLLVIVRLCHRVNYQEVAAMLVDYFDESLE